jgi:hypothetical protein
MMVGPGMEATEKPIATARGKLTKDKLKRFTGAVNCGVVALRGDSY